MYNCHYQFGVSVTAICIDSQMNGFRGSVCTPHPFFKGACNLMLRCFCLAVIICLAALKGIKASLHSWCRYLSVGRSISCIGVVDL